ncbi:hypothetical protein DEO72_LG7g2458 [Vigna unguiculata]|uniref:Uncharacterized protein n=1 Tax=Vigna unguiculata TaxID=3917 RepID=A0A4D6MN22_VIGUN|nr:hypothetical protein DEO72_LG7g2458 [Vigna unguiculata]
MGEHGFHGGDRTNMRGPYNNGSARGWRLAARGVPPGGLCRFCLPAFRLRQAIMLQVSDLRVLFVRIDVNLDQGMLCHERLMDHMCWTTSGQVRRAELRAGRFVEQNYEREDLGQELTRMNQIGVLLLLCELADGCPEGDKLFSYRNSSERWASMQAFGVLCRETRLTPTMPLFFHFYKLCPTLIEWWISFVVALKSPIGMYLTSYKSFKTSYFKISITWRGRKWFFYEVNRPMFSLY